MVTIPISQVAQCKNTWGTFPNTYSLSTNTYSLSPIGHPFEGEKLCSIWDESLGRQTTHYKKWLMKILLQSDTIEQGKPCNLTTSWMNTSATYFAEKGWQTGMTWPYLFSQSTTTKIVSFPMDLSNPDKIHSDGLPKSARVERGCSNLARDRASDLFLSHTMHCFTWTWHLISFLFKTVLPYLQVIIFYLFLDQFNIHKGRDSQYFYLYQLMHSW